MGFNLGQNPYFLILLTFLEIFLILIPAGIVSLIENKRFIQEIKEMGFQRADDFIWYNFGQKLLLGLSLGLLIFLLAGYIMFFFRNILIENILGTDFVQSGQKDSINTSPINPDIIQLLIIILLQIIIIGPCEEGFFRGFIIKKSELKITKVWAVIISSTCFAFYHVPPFLVPLNTIITYFGYYFTMGFLFSFIFLYSDYSLVACSSAHSFSTF